MQNHPVATKEVIGADNVLPRNKSEQYADRGSVLMIAT